MSQMEKSFASNLQPRNCQFSRAELWEREIFLVAVFFFSFFGVEILRFLLRGRNVGGRGHFFFKEFEKVNFSGKLGLEFFGIEKVFI